MPDTMHAVAQRARRPSIDAEWRELSLSLDRVAAQVQAAVARVRDIPRPLIVNPVDQAQMQKAIEGFAEQMQNALEDLIGDLTGPVCRRADGAGIDPATLTIDLSELARERAALCRETKP